MTTNLPAAALTESAALRRLDLPHSRRDWLREQLPSVPTGSGLIYEAAAVDRLSAKLAAVRDADKLNTAENAALHRRDTIGGNASTR